MPMKSKAQSAAMHAAASGRSNIGIPKSVGQKFVSESHGQSVKKLPQTVEGPKRRGGIDKLKSGDYRRR